MNISRLSEHEIQVELERLADKTDLVWNEQIYYEKLIGRIDAIRARQHLADTFANMFPTTTTGGRQ